MDLLGIDQPLLASADEVDPNARAAGRPGLPAGRVQLRRLGQILGLDDAPSVGEGHRLVAGAGEAQADLTPVFRW